VVWRRVGGQLEDLKLEGEGEGEEEGEEKEESEKRPTDSSEFLFDEFHRTLFRSVGVWLMNDS
jgi:hypothetical protein